MEFRASFSSVPYFHMDQPASSRGLCRMLNGEGWDIPFPTDQRPSSRMVERSLQILKPDFECTIFVLVASVPRSLVMVDVIGRGADAFVWPMCSRCGTCTHTSIYVV